MNNLLGIVQQITGEEGKKEGVNNIFFCSPLRTENTPSFCVHPNENKWKDFGTGQHGDIIDLIRLLKNVDYQTAKEIARTNFNWIFEQNICREKKRNSDRQQMSYKLSDFNDNRLIQYANDRSVNFNILKKFCCQAVDELNYTYICFKNDKNGFELRNKYYKKCSSPKTITTINNNSNKLLMFEGFFDFLSFVSLISKIDKYNYVILNSISHLDHLPKLEYDEINLYFDNDSGGDLATNYLQSHYSNAIDRRYNFKNYNDVNDYIISLKNK